MGSVVVRELSIEKIAPGGEGVAFVSVGDERRAVFLRDVAVGDVVRAEVDLGSRPARGRVSEIVKPGPGRIAPPCEAAARCGGCDLMHMTAEARRAAYVDLVREVLPPSFRTVPELMHPAPRDLGYRTRARVHVHAKRRLELGFLGTGSHRIVEVPTCVVLDPAVERARVALGAWLRGAEGRGEARIALGAFPDRLPVLDLAFSGELPPSFYAALDEAVRSGALGGASVLQEGATRPALIGAPAPWMRAADGKPLRLAPGGFGQASDDGNALLGSALAEMLDAIGLTPKDGGPRPASVVELFAGAGNFTVMLGARADKVVAVEADAAACEAARENLAHRGLRAKVTTKDADTFPIPRGLDLVLLDPPRAGARGATAAIAAARPAHVIYVSCDPPTLGRDLAELAAVGYVARRIELFELFPQTSHVETMVLLERGPRKATPAETP